MCGDEIRVRPLFNFLYAHRSERRRAPARLNLKGRMKREKIMAHGTKFSILLQYNHAHTTLKPKLVAASGGKYNGNRRNDLTVHRIKKE